MKMKKYTTLSIIAATVLMMTGTSLIAAEENTNYTKYGHDSNAWTGTASFGVGAGYNEQTYFATAVNNTMLGHYAGSINRGNDNTYVGNSSGYGSVGWGTENVSVGSQSSYIGGGSSNVMIGYASGHDSYASSSVYLGYEAGYSNTRDNTLYIANSDTESPLIYGEFDNDMVRINGRMEVNSTKVSKTDQDIYPFMKITGNDLPLSEMHWNMGIAKPSDDSAQRFYIRNNNNVALEKSPFSISGGAQDHTLVVGSAEEGMESNVGIGTNAPQAKLHVQGDIMAAWSGSNEVDDGLKTLVLLSADNSAAGKASDAGFAMVNKKQDFQWNFRTLEYKNAFTATKEGSGGGEFIIQSPTNDYHDAIMKVGGVTIFAGGQLLTPSSRELKTDIKPLDTQAAMDAFHKLQPVTYAYKAHKEEPVVGFIAEDIPDLVATKSRTGIDSTEIVAVLTKVVQEQDIQMKAMKADYDRKLAAQDAEIAELKIMKKKVAMMESILTNLALETSNNKKEKVSLNSK